jgi:hypothetical protein
VTARASHSLLRLAGRRRNGLEDGTVMRDEVPVSKNRRFQVRVLAAQLEGSAQSRRKSAPPRPGRRGLAHVELMDDGPENRPVSVIRTTAKPSRRRTRPGTRPARQADSPRATPTRPGGHRGAPSPANVSLTRRRSSGGHPLLEAQQAILATRAGPLDELLQPENLRFAAFRLVGRLSTGKGRRCSGSWRGCSRLHALPRYPLALPILCRMSRWIKKGNNPFGVSRL